MKKNENNSYANKYKIKPKSKSVINRKKRQPKVSNKTTVKEINNFKEKNENLISDKNKQKQINNNDSKSEKIEKTPNDSLIFFEEKTYYNLLKKERNILTQYLNENSKNIKLIGNERYKKIPLNKFLYDDKRNLPENTMGLIPIPLKSNRRKSKFGELYKIQRGLVSLRRLQYEKNRKKKENKSKRGYIEYVIFIQTWWKKLLFKKKIIKILLCVSFH